MIIDTLSWGELEVTEDQIYHFPKGIPGFEDEREFALIKTDDSPFSHLQSVTERNLSFLLADPFIFYPEYEFELGSSDLEELNIQSQVVIRCMLTLQDQVDQSTINLLAPLALNPDNQIGKQVILHQTSYGTKHVLIRVHEPQLHGKDGE